MFPHRRRCSLVTLSPVLRRLLVDLDQLRDVVLQRRLGLLTDSLQRSDHDNGLKLNALLELPGGGGLGRLNPLSSLQRPPWFC